MMEKLARYRKQNCMVFDFETCSLNLTSKENKPWQLAFTVYEGGKLVESNDYFIFWEDLRLSEGARKVTGFNDAKYKRLAKPAKEVLDHFEKYLYDDSYLKIGHNILGFDIYIHNIFRKLLGLPTDYSYLNNCIDTLCLAKAIHKEIDINDDDDLLAWQFKLNSLYERGMRLSLAACCKKYEIDLDPNKLHDALYDIQKNHEVFKKMIWNVKI
jgi:DNA polymerase III alpha subunit (gram-positive type)